MRLRVPRMQWRIASAIILLILVTVSILSAVFLSMLRARYLQALEVGLAGQARLIAGLTPSLATPLDQGVVAWQQQLEGRVTLVGADGAVLVDVPPILAPGTDMRDRPEVQDALQFGRGEATRSRAATGEEMFYVAVPAPTSQTVAVVRVGVPLTMVAEAQRQILNTVLITAGLAILGAVAIALLLARQITRPLHSLRTMATRLAGGELDVAVPLPADEDLAALAADFNQMAQVLRHLITSREAERQRLATTVMTMADGLLMISADDQVTSLNPAAEVWLAEPPAGLPFALGAMPMGPALLRAIQRARNTPPDQMPLVLDEVPLAPDDPRALRAMITCLPPPHADQAIIVLQDMTDLRRAERSRRMLLTNLSHDFRTPLTSLRAIVDTLQDGALDDPAAAQEFLGRMDAEVESLNHLVSEFLELSQLEAGQVRFQPEPVDIRQHLIGVVGRMTAQAQAQAVDLALDVPAIMPPLWLDPRRCEQVLLNLLQNALAFTPAGGRITVRASLADAALHIAVQDTGAGIAAADVPHIFERFYRADRARSRPGAGLGLAIVRHLIELQGGQVAAASDLGRGTTISLSLPLTPPPRTVHPPITP